MSHALTPFIYPSCRQKAFLRTRVLVLITFVHEKFFWGVVYSIGTNKCTQVYGKYFVYTMCIQANFNILVCFILIIKANEMNSFSYLFDKVLYMFRRSPLSIIRSILTL
jgi:hypothetical protein